MVGKIGRAGTRFGVLTETQPLLSAFPLTNEPLWHYTKSEEAAQALVEGRVWLTRADCFEDDQEIRFGLGVLEDAFAATANPSRYSTLLQQLQAHLEHTYIFSASVLQASAYLAATYAGPTGYQVGFNATLGLHLRQGWETLPDHPGAPDYLEDRFADFEGMVLYDPTRQAEVARLAVAAVDEWAQTRIEDAGTKIVAERHLLDGLVHCAVLFKRPQFEPEREYRVWLVRKKGTTDLERERIEQDRVIRYIAVRSPLAAEAAEMHAL